jgi:tetratricopeptide (TPR) repeat protein
LSYGRYLAKMVWPSGLAPFYPWSDRLPLAPVLGSLALLLAVTGLAFGQARKRPWLIAGWAWYGLALLPVCGLIRVGSHAWADRYSYLPLAGVWVALAWEAGARVSGRPRARAVLAVLAGSAVLACALAAWRQAGYWRDTAVLFRHTLAVTGPNPMIESNLAAVLYKRGEGESGLVHARRAVMLNPDNSSARNNLGVLLNAAGNPEEAVVHYAKAVDLAPAYAEARANLGGVLLQRGRVDEAVPHLEQAAALKPDDDKTLANLGSARFFQGRLDEAAGFYLRALAVRPDSATAAFNLGAVRERQGRYAEAADWFGKAVALKPGDAEARRRLEAVRLRVP